jgi:hypothetical protein
MTMPNKTYELRNLYFQQSQYSAKQAKPDYPPLLQWPEKGCRDRFKLDSDLLQKALSPIQPQPDCLANQVFGNQKKQEYISLKHLAHVLYVRSELHRQHVKEIDRRHIEIQEKKFGVEINNFSDRGKRLSNLESQLLQLEQQRRDEELAFWKDSVELRQQLFENATAYRDAKHRYSVFSDVEGKYAG